MPSPQFTQQAASIGISPIPLTLSIIYLFCKITYKQYSTFLSYLMIQICLLLQP